VVENSTGDAAPFTSPSPFTSNVEVNGPGSRIVPAHLAPM
jgi:hypothetical protein